MISLPWTRSFAAGATLLTLLSCRSPSDAGREPIPAQIAIEPSRDTLYYAGWTDTVDLVAAVTDQFGQEFTTDSVAWSVSGDVSIEPTGRRSARLFWPRFTLAGGVIPLTVTASLADVGGTRTVISCAASALVVQTSGTIVLNRPTALASSLNSLTGTPSYSDLPVARTWTTSDAGVAALDGGNVVGASVGTATLTASACGVSDTVTVDVIASEYSVMPVRPPGAATSTGVDLTDSGLIVGTSDLAAGLRNFMYDGGVFTDLGDCQPLRANDAGQVLCWGIGQSAPVIWEAGAAMVRDTITGYSAALSPSGMVAIRRGPTVLLWSAPGVYDTASVGTLSVFDLNDMGRFTATLPLLYPAPAVWHDDQTVTLSAPGRYANPEAIDGAGTVAVGWGENGAQGPPVAVRWLESESGTWTMEYLRGSGGPFRNALAAQAHDINDAGEVVGSGSSRGFVWRSGRLTVLDDVVPGGWSVENAIRVNAAGQILGFGRNAATGYVGAVLITPP